MIKLTLKMNGKMKGLQSLNMTPLTNKRCLARAKVKGSICNGCYSVRMMKIYKTANTCFDNNAKAMSKPLHQSEIPRTNVTSFRFNAHGELSNKTQLENMVEIALDNPWTTFSLWTKEKHLVKKVFDKYKKPKNFILIHSSLMLNKQEALPQYYDKVFTVFDKNYINDNKVKINCHKSCNDCLKCYKTTDKETYIREQYR